MGPTGNRRVFFIGSHYGDLSKLVRDKNLPARSCRAGSTPYYYFSNIRKNRCGRCGRCGRHAGTRINTGLRAATPFGRGVAEVWQISISHSFFVKSFTNVNRFFSKKDAFSRIFIVDFIKNFIKTSSENVRKRCGRCGRCGRFFDFTLISDQPFSRNLINLNYKSQVTTLEFRT